MARVAFVTGGSRGIGAAIARRLQKDGCKVAVCDVVEEQIGKFKEETGIAQIGKVKTIFNPDTIVDLHDIYFNGAITIKHLGSADNVSTLSRTNV
jgi:NAD(P)-dependent dehydrogenase (short-subunit alcohol dehydrogenase family)